MRSELTSVERKLLGFAACTHAALLVSALVVLVAVTLGAVPIWGLRVFFALLGTYLLPAVPLMLIFGYVANQTLPKDQVWSWVSAFRYNPFAYLLFWWQYLR